MTQNDGLSVGCMRAVGSTFGLDSVEDVERAPDESV
jgi:hypothetical protein